MAVVAARQLRSSVFRRRSALRRPRSRMAALGVSLSTLVAAFVVVGAPGVVVPTPAAAQSFTYNPRPPKPPRPPAKNDGQMLVQANEVDYDYNNQRVSAVGNVQMFYNGTSVEADKVIYDQKTKRLHAEGNIRMTDAEGKITYANIMDLSDDYRDGFVDSLRVDTEDQTRMAATRADRSSGNYTVFENGVYTACAPVRTIRRSRRSGRSRARASSITRPRRCSISRTPSSSSSAFRWRICPISRRPIRR